MKLAVEIDGLRVAYEREGHGPPLLLLHGILGDSRVWRTQFEGLADAFTIIAWDAPGCGDSSDPDEWFSMPAYAYCLSHLMEVLALGPAHVLGLSWGGTLAIEFAARHPEQLRSLILADTYAGWKGSLTEGECAERLRSCLTQSWMDPGEFIPAWMPTLFSPHAPDSVLIEMQTIMSEFHPAGFRTMARTVAATDNRHALTEIRAPTLLLWGEQDVRSPLKVAESMLAAISDSCLAVIPHCGHVSNMEQPERFNEELRSFCRTVSAPTSLIA